MVLRAIERHLRMAHPKCSDEEFITLFNRLGARGVCEHLGVMERSVYARRSALEARGVGQLIAPTKAGTVKEYPHRAKLIVQNGCIIVGSDFHIWPGAESTALRAFKKLCGDLKPVAVILNGDVLDFPQISRHPPIGWENAPTVKDEIEAAQDHLNAIVKAVPRGCRKIWTLGNHDARFETRLATVASEYKGLKGIHLSDFFGVWEKSWSCFINEENERGQTVVKHRFKSGISAPRVNTLHAGMSMVTGHLHSMKVMPFTDYRGDRYGVDGGCCASTDHKAFTGYTEDNPLDWRSGFCVLTYRDYRLMYPELVSVWDDNHVQFRGNLIKC